LQKCPIAQKKCLSGKKHAERDIWYGRTKSKRPKERRERKGRKNVNNPGSGASISIGSRKEEKSFRKTKRRQVPAKGKHCFKGYDPGN